MSFSKTNKRNIDKWINLKGEQFRAPIIQLVRTALMTEKKLGNEIKVCVGADSKEHKDHIEYATAVVFIRKGKGAFTYIRKEKESQLLSIKERMLREVTKAIEIAYEICPTLEEFDIDLEVHADINTDPNFASHVALKEAMGYILGMGYTFKAKPDAFASSSCADLML